MVDVCWLLQKITLYGNCHCGRCVTGNASQLATPCLIASYQMSVSKAACISSLLLGRRPQIGRSTVYEVPGMQGNEVRAAKDVVSSAAI